MTAPRKQNIYTLKGKLATERNLRTAMTKTSLNWTLSGVPIKDGINVLGAARVCSSCGTELAPYMDDCPTCTN